MRVLLQASIPVEAGNATAKDGSQFQTIPSILEEQQPEAVYCLTMNGKRTVLAFLDLESAARIPKLAEPWFLSFNADVQITPVFTPEDMPVVGSDMEEAVRKYG